VKSPSLFKIVVSPATGHISNSHIYWLQAVCISETCRCSACPWKCGCVQGCYS